MMEAPVRIPCGPVTLDGDLSLPRNAQGIVVSAHGSGSSRLSPRNRQVARTLCDAGLATLLFDLLTRPEEGQDALTGHLRFNIPFLSRRLVEVTGWLKQNEDLKALNVGYFGASTGAAAALMAAAELPEVVKAIVSRGGRPDLAARSLPRITAPTLLIVGGEDDQVIPLNQDAFDALPGEKQLVLIPGATHLFEEPGALEEVARLARDWFLKHLVPEGKGKPAL